MNRILVIGGYGGFGERLSRRLSAAGHRVLVGGRSREKAAAACAKLIGAEPVVVDRRSDLAPLLKDLRPDLVIDAAGLFQNSDHAVPRACIAAGVPYLDLADARGFVTGIQALDRAAQDAGVAIISGASSVPGLSGAVTRHLARDMEYTGQVQIAITASTRSAASASVAGAVLSYAGKPIRVWRGQRWTVAHGVQGLRRQEFRVTGLRPLRRWIAVAEVPDLDLLPALIPGRPSVEFRAGTDSSLHMIGLWLASWLVRSDMIRSLCGAAGWLLRLQRLTGLGRGERSAMLVTVKGSRDGEGIERRWTLIAEKFDGPEIPVMAAALLAEDILAGRTPAGARNAAAELELAQFEPMFAALAIRHETTEVRTPPLYEQAMGSRFAALPDAVRAIHSVHGDGGAEGEGAVVWGESLAARLVCRIMRFPPAGSYALHVAFAERGGCETWTRDFGGHRFSSVLKQSGDGVSERFGPIRFDFDLPSDARGLRMHLRGWSIFGIPLPFALAPRIEAHEWGEAERFGFRVNVAMRWIGPVINYSGFLEPIR